MFDKIGQSAEKVVSKVGLSRRGFLGRASKAAAALAAGLTALLTPSPAQASRGRCGCPVYYVPWCFYDNGQAFPAERGCSCPNVRGARILYKLCIRG